MILAELQKTLRDVLSAGSHLDERLVILIQLVAAFGGILLLWRLWRFTIRPSLGTAIPKELPYWIPCKSISMLATGSATRD